MDKSFICFGLAGAFALNLSSLAFTQESQHKQTGGRRLAMALERVESKTELHKKTVFLPALLQPASSALAGKQPALEQMTAKASINPDSEFASHPNISTQSSSMQIPGNVRSVLTEGAAQAEQLSRSPNRRIADVIVWLASSMNQSTTISPLSSPNLQRERVVKPQPLVGAGNEQRNFFQID